MTELICSTNLSFGMYPGLTHGACNALEMHGSEAQKRTFLPNMAHGRWSGTMCLTEPHCGTDLGLIRTRAEADGAGRYQITGTKIFISDGEPALSENIVHPVLEQPPDPPAGTRGVSPFVVPQTSVKQDGL